MFESPLPQINQREKSKNGFAIKLPPRLALAITTGLLIACETEPVHLRSVPPSVVYEMARSEQPIEIPVAVESVSRKPKSVRFPAGKFSDEEFKKRIERWAPGVQVFRDEGMYFYKVQRGDTLKSIRRKLAKIKGYDYLNEQTGKLDSFNIPQKEVKPGMLLPIPQRNSERIITDDAFIAQSRKALFELAETPEYQSYLSELIKIYGENYLIAAMMAIAKQESGGAPMGRFEMHRWEKRYHAFSFSLFHVLMVGPGLKARQKLNLTEGQLYNTTNAGKLFFAFVIEKISEKYQGMTDEVAKKEKIQRELIQLFELDEAMASFYNGKAWRRNNPGYLRNVRKYFTDACPKLGVTHEFKPDNSEKTPFVKKMIKRIFPKHHRKHRHR